MKASIFSQYVSFLKRFVNIKGYLYLLVPLFFLLLLAVTFQNCNTESSLNLPSLVETTTTIRSAQITTTSSSSSTTTTNDGPTMGSLVAYLSSEGSSMAKGQFAVNSTVVFDFEGAHPDSSKFEWTVKKGSEVEDDQETPNAKYQFEFTEVGTYDVSATSYAQGSTDPLTEAEKRIIIGDCTPDTLEILLTSGSLVSGQSATFSLENASDFSSIEWKVTLPSSVEEGTGASITVSFGQSDIGGIFVEVSAVNTGNQCSSQRHKLFNVTAQLEPHFGPIQLVDSNSDAVETTLETNDIYKYSRPTDNSSVFLGLNIQNAESCTYSSNGGSNTTVVCSGGTIDITPAAQGCVENKVTITASNQGSPSKEESYYHYCSSEDCFFGSTEVQPNIHVCSTTPVVCGACGTGSAECGGNGGTGKDSCCSAGSFHGSPDDSTTQYNWTCRNTPYVSASHCSEGAGDDLKEMSCDELKSTIPTTSTSTTTTTNTNTNTTSTTTQTCPVSVTPPHHYKIVDGLCRPSCGVACNNSRSVAGTCASGSSSCGDTANYTIVDMPKTWDQSKCCKRVLKSTPTTTSTTTQTTTTPTVVCGRCGTRSSSCRDGKSGASCCSAGTFSPHPTDTSATNYTWTCRNILHERASHCSEGTGDDTREVRCTTPISGSCNNNAVKYGCSPSSAVATNKSTDGGYDTWHCPGSNGGADATDCKKCNTTGRHYGGASCLPSCGHAKTLHCQDSNNDCTGFTLASGNTCLSTSGYETVINLPNYQGLCCFRK